MGSRLDHRGVIGVGRGAGDFTVAAANRLELAEALVKAALADPHGRAMTHVLDRVDGSVVSQVELSQAGSADDPQNMSASQFRAWLVAQMTPEEAVAWLDEMESLTGPSED